METHELMVTGYPDVGLEITKAQCRRKGEGGKRVFCRERPATAVGDRQRSWSLAICHVPRVGHFVALPWPNRLSQNNVHPAFTCSLFAQPLQTCEVDSSEPLSRSLSRVAHADPVATLDGERYSQVLDSLADEARRAYGRALRRASSKKAQRRTIWHA